MGVLLGGACQALRMDAPSVVKAFGAGEFSEETLAGAISYHATSGKIYLQMLKEDRSFHSESKVRLKDGSERRVKSASNADQLVAMAGISVPENLEKMIEEGLDLSIGVGGVL